MILHSITINNIKSFRKEVTFNPLLDMNVLIGSNGSGKSNLMDIIYVILKHYFLYSYRWLKESDQAGTHIRIDNIRNHFGTIGQILPKYIHDDSISHVKFELEVTQGDCDNLSLVSLKII